MITTLTASLDQSGLSVEDRSLGGLNERIIGTIIGAFYSVHRELGSGFLESVYHKALALELAQRGVAFDHQVPLSVFYRGRKIGHFRADLCVEGKVVVSVRSGATVSEWDRAQLVNSVRSSNVPVGLLLHFGVEPLFERVDTTPHEQ
ncbi:MAG: GxxExxY protein [Gemmatimonadota bacterium]